MKEKVNTLIAKSTPLFPKRVHRTKIGKVDAVLGVVVLWWQSLRNFGHLIGELSVASKQLEEHEPRARGGRSYSRIYSTALNWTTNGRRARR